VEEVANLIISKAIKSSMMCRFNLKSAALAKVACDCGTSPGNDCFDNIPDVPIGEQRFFSGIGGVAEWSAATVTVDATSGVPAEQDDALIEATSSGSVHVLLERTINVVARRRLHKMPHNKRSPTNPNQYEVVTNNNDYIVGQLLSDGVTLTIPPNVTINVCINIDGDIPRDPEMLYPVQDFASYNATSGKWTPLNLTITMVGDYVQFCADISESGTFFAILRTEPWEFVTGAPTLAPTPSPTLAPTVPNATTMAPTYAPIESSLSGGALIGIVLGSLAGVGLIVVLVVACTAGETEVVIEEWPADETLLPTAAPIERQARYTAKGKTRHGFKKYE